MSLSKDRAEFTQDLAHFVQWCVVQGGFSEVYVDEVKRTVEQQKLYFDAKKSKTMNSMHLKGLAADIVFFKDGMCVNLLPGKEQLIILTEAGKYWESLSVVNRWGGNFDKDWDKPDPWLDTPHFERNV